MSNPVPSNKISDGKLNFESLDEFVNADESQLVITTRTGKQISSISGIVGEVESRRATAIGTIDGYVAQVESSRNSAINTINQAEADVQQELQDAIARTGYNFIGEFTDGGTLESRVDALRFDGEWYRWDGALPKVVPPASTPSAEGGVGSGAWVGVGDAALRENLANPDFGAALVAYRERTVKDKLDDAVNILDFGATGNDVESDTDAMNAALDASDWVLIPNIGTKYIFANVELISGKRITGIGRPLIELQGRDWSGVPKVGVFNVDDDATGVVIEGLRIDGNKQNITAAQEGNIEGMNIDGIGNFVIDCEIFNCLGDGIDLDGRDDSAFQGNIVLFNEVYDCDGFGIHNSTRSNGNIIGFNHAYSNGFARNRGGIDVYFGAAPAQSQGNHLIIGNYSHDNYQNYDISGGVQRSQFIGNRSGGSATVADNFNRVALPVGELSPYIVAQQRRASGTTPGALLAESWTKGTLDSSDTNAQYNGLLSLITAGANASTVRVDGIRRVKLKGSATLYNEESEDMIFQIRVGNSLRWDASHSVIVRPGESAVLSVEAFRSVPANGANFEVQRYFRYTGAGTPSTPIGFPADSGQDELFTQLIVERIE